MAFRIVKSEDRMPRIRALRPGEAVNVANDPPLATLPRDMIVTARGDRLIIRRLTEKEFALLRLLEASPELADDPVFGS
jgi:hypothetical protein